MEIIREALKCSICRLILSEPVVLPCGEFICHEHVVNNIENHVFCVECDTNHEYTLENCSFPRVRALEKILATQIDKFDFGKRYSRAYKSCKKLEQALFDFEKLLADPYNHIYEVVNELRNEVEIKRENMKLLLTEASEKDGVDKQAEALISEINGYENECRTNLKTNEFVENSNELKDGELKRMNLEMAKLLAELNVLEEEEVKWISVNDSCEKLFNLLQVKEFAYKQDLMLNRKLEVSFDEKPNEFVKLCNFSIDSLSSSRIVTDVKLRNDLMKLCEFDVYQEWKLLYRASVDGFSRKIFHKKCDNKQPTLVIIKSINGNIFGGFTTALWNSQKEKALEHKLRPLQASLTTNKYKKLKYYIYQACQEFYKVDVQAFIFSLINEENSPLKINANIEQSMFAIYCGSKHGLGFGRYGDLSFGFGEDGDDMTKGLSNLGLTFSHPTHSNKSKEAQTFLAGYKWFDIVEIECYLKC